MKLPKCKIESAVSDEESRYAISSVLLDPEKGVCVATDGHQIAVVPCEPEKHDVRGLVPKKAFTLARAAEKRIPKKQRVTAPAVTMTVNGRVNIRSRFNDEVFSVRKGDGKFPEWEGLCKGFEGAPDLVINLAVLAKAVEAISDSSSRVPYGVALWINKKQQPSQGAMLVAPAMGDSKAFAIVMPMREWNQRKAEKIIGTVSKGE